MERITMQSQVWQELLSKINRIERFIIDSVAKSGEEKTDTENLWLDNDTVCAYLKVSKRTLQRYRSNGVIAYSIIGRKTYYSVASVTQLLKDRNIRRDKPSLEEQEEKGRIHNQLK